MYIKYIILLCSTCCIPSANSISDEEIENLWWALTSDGDYIYDNKFYQIYFDEERKELEQVMKNFGSTFENDKDDAIYRMDFENFKKAASKGYIHRWSKQAMKDAFIELIPIEENRDYITHHDIITRSYEGKILYNIDTVMTEVNEAQPRMSFHSFRKAMNFGLIPSAKCEYTSLVAIHMEFGKIVHEEGKAIYITSKDIVKNYVPRLELITGGYGQIKDNDVYYELDLDNFIKAVSRCHLRIPLCGERLTSPTELQTVFKSMTNDTITLKHLIKYYEPQIETIIRRFGQFHNGEYVLFFHDYREVIIKNYLPLKL